MKGLVLVGQAREIALRNIAGYRQRLADRAASIDYFLDCCEPEPNSGCWLWLRGGVKRYGLIKGMLAHRAAWVHFVGPIPPGMQVLHRCDTPPCVNPRHLFLGTQADNMADMRAKGRAAICRGESNPRAKITAEIAATIREAAASGQSRRGLAVRYGLSKSSVRSIVEGRNWRWVAPLRAEASR